MRRSAWPPRPPAFVGTLLLVLLVAVVAAVGAAGTAVAQAQPQDAAPFAQRDDGLIRQGQMDRGALLFQTDAPGLYAPAPLLSTKIDVAVAGPIARTVVTQRFTNPAEVFVEGKYVFPLPEGAAVDKLRMRVADRLIEGEIEEREEARRVYEQAKSEGFVASLVEQERPNVFTTSVANIAPSATIVIQIEYQETLAPRDGVFGLRLPLVVAPRYAPAPLIQTVKLGPEGWEVSATDPVPDRDRITPPVADPRDEAPGTLRNPVDISVDIEAGFPLGPIRSLYHEVLIQTRGTDAASIRLDGPAPADRDFYLSWRPATLSEPYVALFAGLAEEVVGPEAEVDLSDAAGPGAEDPSADAAPTAPEETTEADPETGHYLLMITPPSAEAVDAARLPREVIFVQDISGSMFGESIAQAKAGLELAVKRLRPDDVFNIIVFNDRFGLFADAPIPATEANVARAIEAIRALEADGGTEMLPALDAALKAAGGDPAPEERPERIRQVVFLTDGAVGNEREMLRLIERELGASRLFTVGIGSAPNSYFMTAAAEAGRGTHVFIGDLAEVQERMEALFQRIETPAVVDLDLIVDGFQAPEVWPNPLRDVYAGDPVVATIRVDPGLPTRAERRIRLSGVRGGAAWTAELDLDDATPRPGVAKLWARQRIKALEALRLSPDMDEPGRARIDAEILDTALAHQLVSRLTSLVAVDVTPTRPLDAPQATREIPLNLPKGWDAEAFFNDLDGGPIPLGVPDGLQDAALTAPALARLSAAAEARATAQAQRGVALPATSADWLAQAAAGVFLVLFGVLLLRGGRGGRARAPRPAARDGAATQDA